jgi:hypothetical protein
MSSDRSRDVSDALTEVRTVLSRAETAMEALVRRSCRDEAPDPDTDAMYYALERTVRDLARWRKAGKGKTR